MKKVLLLLIVPFLAFSCLGKDDDQAEVPVIVETGPDLVKTYTLYPSGLGIRETPAQSSSTLFATALLDVVYWTGETTEAEGYTWLEVQNEDGSEVGWCWEMYLAPHGDPAIMTDKMIIYTQPDIMSVSDQFIEKYQIGAIVGEDGDFYEIKWVAGTRAKHGFIKKDNISFGEDGAQDIRVYRLLQMAEAASDNYDRAREFLDNALEISSSSFYQDAREASRNLEDQQSGAAAPALVRMDNGSQGSINNEGVNIRSLPSLDSDALGRLTRGVPVTVLDSTSVAESIDGVGTGYWYQVEFDEEEGMGQGWIFGLFIDF